MDTIHIRDLHLRCIVGIKEEERTKKQEILLNISIDTDLARAGQTDQLADTVDYAALKAKVMTAAEESNFFLIERLAERVAQVCLDHPAVQRVRVIVDKPTALRFTKSVAVEIVRERKK